MQRTEGDSIKLWGQDHPESWGSTPGLPNCRNGTFAPMGLKGIALSQRGCS